MVYFVNYICSLLCEVFMWFTLWTCWSSLLCEPVYIVYFMNYLKCLLYELLRGKEGIGGKGSNNVYFMNYWKRTPGDNKLLNNNNYP